MPKTRRAKPIYQRGEYRLHPRPGRNHEIIWYDGKRERSRSAGSSCDEEAIAALDRLYTKRHGGIPCCPTCRRPLDQSREAVSVLIANYLETKVDGDAIHPRLAHVLGFIEAENRADDAADGIDEDWAQAFRDWMAGRTDRIRAPGTIENSLIQLAAALRFGGVEPGFKPIPTIDVNRSPQFRASIATISAMFRYCLEPKGRTEKEVARRRRERENLLRFLRASVATWARPDAAHDISTRPDRRQWVADARVLRLNPDGRKQTRKRRAVVPVPRQFAPHMEECDGFYVTVDSVKAAWESMAADLGLPGDGEAGMKLIRRSIMTLARRRLGEEHWVQGRMMAGHMKFTVSDVYALPDPANLGLALKATEAIIDEIEALAPGAFYRDFTAQGGNVASIARGLSA